MSKNDDMPQPPDMPLNFSAKCEVCLTPAQRAYVKSETGRDMEVLVLSDKDGGVTRSMSERTPEAFTVLAVRQARLLNAYDEDYHAYLVALAAWEAGLDEPDPMDELSEASRVAAEQEAERQKLFYMQEAQACSRAREAAKIAWGKKDASESAS